VSLGELEGDGESSSEEDGEAEGSPGQVEVSLSAKREDDQNRRVEREVRSTTRRESGRID
jgi:hypothetical protein